MVKGIFQHVLCILFGHQFHQSGKPRIINQRFCCWRCTTPWDGNG